jgi:carbonic anhydrase
MTVDIIYRYGTQDGLTRPAPPDSSAALLRLNRGNSEFSSLLGRIRDETGRIEQVIAVDPRDLGIGSVDSGVPTQHPFAAILGCSDARVPVELIFNQGPNDLFVVRVAGNGLGTDVLGSLKYAADNLGGSLKLIVVLGHSGCGAVSAAVDVFLNPRGYLSFATQPSLRGILDGLLVVVQASAQRLVATFGPEVVHRPGYRHALIETSVASNAALAAFSIQQELNTSETADVRAAYGVYLLENRAVWSAGAGGQPGIGLAAAPIGRAEFAGLGDAIVRSARISSILDPAP